MKKKLLAATLMAAMTITTVFGGSAVLAADDAASTKVITDSMGNEVEVPTEIKSMAILPMPWISVVYALNGSGDIITGMQQVAKNSYETSILKKLAPELEDTNTTFFADTPKPHALQTLVLFLFCSPFPSLPPGEPHG